MSKFATAIINSIIIILIGVAISHAGDFGIRQDHYTYKMSVVQNMETDTFVIEPLKNIKKDKIVSSPQSDQSSVDKMLNISQSNRDCKITIHFKFNSFAIAPKQSQKLIKDIYKSCVPDTVFKVTGYSCEIGPENYNKTLSLLRARAVAAVMKRHGFLTATVQGKGSQNPVTESVAEYYKNRRVEIQSK